MNIKKIIEKTGINPKTMARKDLIALAEIKDFGLRALHQVMDNCDGNLTSDDYMAAREAYSKRKSSNTRI